MAPIGSWLGAVLDTVVAQAAPAPASWWNHPQDADAEKNVLLFPAEIQPTVNGTLANVEGGLVHDSTLRPRASVIVGPGATLTGIANRIRQLYVAADAASAPSAVEIARALVTYHRYYLVPPGIGDFRVGLRIPLPIERDETASRWVLSSDRIREWSAAFDAPWAPALTQRVGLLRAPATEPAGADPWHVQDAQQFLRDNATASARAGALIGRLLKNAFDVVLVAFEVFRRVAQVDALEIALAAMDQLVNHQLDLLASLTAGNAVLQRLERIVSAAAGPNPQDLQARIDRAATMLRNALRPGGQAVAPREVSETAHQLADRPGGIGGGAIAAADPSGRRHRMVLGRDVLAGRIQTYTQANGNQFRGAAYAGRLDIADFITRNRALINPTNDAAMNHRLRIVQAISPNEGWLDAIRMQDAGILSSGIQQWSAHVDTELFPMLVRFKDRAPEEFLLYLGLYRMEVQPGAANSPQQPNAQLFRVEPSGALTAIVSFADRRAFFGGTVNGNLTEFATDWAVRFRMTSLASTEYKVAQCQMGASRFDRIAFEVGNLTIGGVAHPVNTIFTSDHGVALILDQHINAPGNVANNLQTAINNVPNTTNFNVDPNAFEQAAVNYYENHRTMADAQARANFIVGLNLDRNHGSFGGW